MEPDSGSHGRFSCPVDSCDRSFRRKEHLTRHQRTHNPGSSHVCHVCSRKFNRSDSLLRHLSRHGEVFQGSASRSKQACIACHTAKTKCDGNKQCLACVKKGFKCRYRRKEDEDDHPPAAPQDISLQGNQGIPRAPGSSSDGTTPTLSLTNTERGSTPSNYRRLRTVQITDSASDNVTAGTQAQPISLTLGLPMPRSEGFIDWSMVKIQHGSSKEHESAALDSLKDHTGFEKYLDHYFTHFHHRWPIVHRTSYNDSDKGTVLQALISSMVMIGAWLEGSPESREYAITLHHEMMSQCFLRLSKISSKDTFQQSLPAGLCQAALMNVIFVLYHGTEEIISRGIMLRNILVAVLREVRFFNPDTMWADEKPGYFIPMHWMKMGERQRLAENLFKIDSYLNILRGQPPLLATEELIFQLPSSFSLWNSDGLHKLEERLGNLPLLRSEKSISEMIADNTTEPTIPLGQGLLWEDLQLCFCNMQSGLWQLHTRTQNPNEIELEIISQRNTLKKILQALRSQFDQMTSQPTGSLELRQREHFVLPHYYGFEDHSVPGWEAIVIARVEGLLFDTMMLYHLLNLHLLTDVYRTTQVAHEYGTNQDSTSQKHRCAVEKRRCMTAGWIVSPNARNALCHAADVLIEYRNSNNIPGLEQKKLDPIVYIALSTAALVVWAHCSFGLYPCDNCTPTAGLDANNVTSVTSTVELAKSSQSAAQQDNDREAWVESGGNCRVEISGLKICLCNVGVLLAQFKSCLPTGWELADTIAPGIFRRPDSGV